MTLLRDKGALTASQIIKQTARRHHSFTRSIGWGAAICMNLLIHMVAAASRSVTGAVARGGPDRRYLDKCLLAQRNPIDARSTGWRSHQSQGTPRVHPNLRHFINQPIGRTSKTGWFSGDDHVQMRPTGLFWLLATADENPEFDHRLCLRSRGQWTVSPLFRFLDLVGPRSRCLVLSTWSTRTMSHCETVRGPERRKCRYCRRRVHSAAVNTS